MKAHVRKRGGYWWVRVNGVTMSVPRHTLQDAYGAALHYLALHYLKKEQTR